MGALLSAGLCRWSSGYSEEGQQTQVLMCLTHSATSLSKHVIRHFNFLHFILF